MSKIALVESGGGMAACYIAGATYALATKFNHFKPDIVIGGSGSTGTLSYYVSSQPESIKNIWLNLLSTKKFVNPLRVWRIMDIDYLIDVVFKKQDPLHTENIYNSRIEYLISSTNHKTGMLEYFSNKRKDNVFESMRASMALPLAFNKYVKVKHREYCDTDISASVKFNVEKAVELGAQKILVINVSNLYESRFTDFVYNLWLKRQSRRFIKNYLTEEHLQCNIPRGIKIFQVEPKVHLKMGSLSTKKETLKQVFEQGYDDVLDNKKLREFLSS